MAALLVRPYPVKRLAEAREALAAAQTGALAPLAALFIEARDALLSLDPDAITDPVRAHPAAPERDKSALLAAMDVADTWEGVVAVAATITSLPRLRGFLWTAAWCRYLDEDDPSLEDFKASCRGSLLPGLSVEDTVLYASLPMLLGLGPELPDELPRPAPATGVPAWRVLGLPDEDWAGVDPIDAQVISAEDCAAQCSAVQGPWRAAFARGASEGGLIVRAES